MIQRLFALLVTSMAVVTVQAEPMPTKWIDATAYVVPKETATEGEGYFSIIEGHNRRITLAYTGNVHFAEIRRLDLKPRQIRQKDHPLGNRHILGLLNIDRTDDAIKWGTKFRLFTKHLHLVDRCLSLGNRGISQGYIFG